MVSHEYLGPSSFTLTWAPARAAYLIAPESEAGMRLAIREASSRWGGLTEPILPLAESADLEPWWNQVLELSNVDGLVLVDADRGTAEQLSERTGMLLVDLAYIDRDGLTSFSISPASVYSWRDDPNPPVIAQLDGDLWQLVAAGDLDAEHLAHHLKDGHPVRRPSTDDGVGRAQFGGGTLIQRTLLGLDESSASGRVGASPAVVWLCGEEAFQECLYYWNVRALAPVGWGAFPMVFLPAHALSQWLVLAQSVRGLLIRPDEFSPDVHLTSLSLSDQELANAATLLELVPSREPPRFSRRWPPPDLRTAPFTYLTNLDVRQPVVFERQYGSSTQIETVAARPTTTMRVNSPVTFTGHGRTLLRMASPLLDGLPRRDQVAGLVIRGAHWKDQALRVATEAQHQYLLELTVPTLREVTELLLKQSASTYSLSDKGRLGTPLCERGEGLQHLRAPGVIASLSSLTTPRSKELLKELERVRASGMPLDAFEQLANNWGQRSERLFKNARDVIGSGGSLAALETLVGLGWAQRGLEVRCPVCGVKSFVALADTVSTGQCPGCFSEQPYTADNKQLDLKYRLSTFIDRCGDQGMMPPLLVIAALRAKSEHLHVLPGVNLQFPDGHSSETDIFGVHDGKVFAGEVKTQASKFTQGQVERDVDTSKRLGVDVHIMASLDEIPAETVTRARELCERAGIQLRPMSGQALLDGG